MKSDGLYADALKKGWVFLQSRKGGKIVIKNKRFWVIMLPSNILFFKKPGVLIYFFYFFYFLFLFSIFYLFLFYLFIIYNYYFLLFFIDFFIFFISLFIILFFCLLFFFVFNNYK